MKFLIRASCFVSFDANIYFAKILMELTANKECITKWDFTGYAIVFYGLETEIYPEA